MRYLGTAQVCPSVPSEPTCYTEAMQYDQWRQAMDSVFSSSQKQDMEICANSAGSKSYRQQVGIQAQEERKWLG